ncbi:MAG: hypothetical protein ACK41E_03775 [Deinococcales bacterium]
MYKAVPLGDAGRGAGGISRADSTPVGETERLAYRIKRGDNDNNLFL